MAGLIILLALVVGVLYCLHLLVKDYQALTAAPRLLRMLFKRDLNPSNYVHTVKWKRIFIHDSAQCARFLYCGLGTQPPEDDVQKGFIHMLELDSREEDQEYQELYKVAYREGRTLKSIRHCRKMYPFCPFSAGLLFKIIQYLLRSPQAF